MLKIVTLLVLITMMFTQTSSSSSSSSGGKYKLGKKPWSKGSGKYKSNKYGSSSNNRLSNLNKKHNKNNSGHKWSSSKGQWTKTSKPTIKPSKSWSTTTPYPTTTTPSPTTTTTTTEPPSTTTSCPPSYLEPLPGDKCMFEGECEYRPTTCKNITFFTYFCQCDNNIFNCALVASLPCDLVITPSADPSTLPPTTEPPSTTSLPPTSTTTTESPSTAILCPPQRPEGECIFEGICSYGEFICCGEIIAVTQCFCNNGIAVCQDRFSQHCQCGDTTTTEPPFTTSIPPTPSTTTSSECPPDPMAASYDIDEKCAFEGICEYGEISCCGKTEPDHICECIDGIIKCVAKLCPCNLTTKKPVTPSPTISTPKPTKKGTVWEKSM